MVCNLNVGYPFIFSFSHCCFPSFSQSTISKDTGASLNFCFNFLNVGCAFLQCGHQSTLYITNRFLRLSVNGSVRMVK